jgi:hypothetical protein
VIKIICATGALVAAVILFRAWLRHTHWWLFLFSLGLLGASFFALLSFAVDQIGRQGLIAHGLNPKVVLQVLLWLPIVSTVLQTLGIIGCCLHFIFRPQK